MIESLRGRPLLGLLGLVLAVLVWALADGWAEQRRSLDQRKSTAARLLARESQAGGKDLAEAWLAARTRRAALLQRLQIDEGMETARARLYYELREHCAAVKLSCAIRLANSGKSSAAEVAAAEGSLEALGIQRIRIQVSGNLGDQDIRALLNSLAGDPAAQWRIKQIQVRGRAFELDVERHLVPGGGQGVGDE